MSPTARLKAVQAHSFGNVNNRTLPLVNGWVILVLSSAIPIHTRAQKRKVAFNVAKYAIAQDPLGLCNLTVIRTAKKFVRDHLFSASRKEKEKEKEKKKSSACDQ